MRGHAVPVRRQVLPCENRAVGGVKVPIGEKDPNFVTGDDAGALGRVFRGRFV